MSFIEIAKQSRASQDPFELWQLLEAVAKVKPQKILEIGVHRGYSAETWRTAFPNCEVVGVECDVSHIDYSAFRLINGRSTHSGVIEQVRKMGPYQFLFIDGDHTYEGTKLDWINYSPMVVPAGIVALHDTARIGEQWKGNVETHQLFEELKRSHHSAEFIGASEHSPGTGLLYLT